MQQTCFCEDVDIGPVDPDLSEYIDFDILQEYCKNCRLREIEKKLGRTHKAQTFRRA